jgi:leucine-rich repeat protein SHOC2
MGKLSNLRVLSCAYNLIPTIPPELQTLASLQVLDFKSNLLLNSPNSLIAKVISGASVVESLHSLVNLDLSLNKMSIAPNMSRLHKLRSCNLAKNDLQDFPPGLSGLKSLEVLDLSENQLTAMPITELECLVSLKRLILSHNQLKGLACSIHHLKALELLVVSHNQLASVPPALGGMPALARLDLASNCIETIDADAFSPSLEHIVLKHNLISELPDTIRSLTRLESLDLSYNHITVLPATIPSSIKELRLSNNCLQVCHSNLNNLNNCNLKPNQ